jgi:hypothetical protein
VEKMLRYDGHPGWTSKVMKLGRPPTAPDAAVCNNRDFGSKNIETEPRGGVNVHSH